MTKPRIESHPKASELFEGLKQSLDVSRVQMIPFDELPTIDEFTDVRDWELVNPWHLTDLAPTRDEGYPVAHGIAMFATSKLVVKDRANHWIPHVPGPETEHAYLNLVRAAAKDIGVIAPVEMGVYRQHIRAVPIDQPVRVELHNLFKGELAKGRRIKAFGVALGFLRDTETGDPYTQALLQWSDKAPNKTE